MEREVLNFYARDTSKSKGIKDIFETYLIFGKVILTQNLKLTCDPARKSNKARSS